MSPVVEFFLDPTTNFKSQIGRDRHIASIEQAVDISPKQQTVSGFVLAAVTIGADMRGFERRQRPFLCNRAAAAVGVGHEHAESPLPEARSDQLWLSVPGRRFGLNRPGFAGGSNS